MELVLGNSRLTFKLEPKRGINILKGDSSTGKTLLYNIAMHIEDGSYGFTSNFAGDVLILDRLSPWQAIIKKSSNKFIFLDEHVSYIYSREFADLVADSDNYFILSTRRVLKYIDPTAINTATFTMVRVKPLIKESRGIDTVKKHTIFFGIDDEKYSITPDGDYMGLALDEWLDDPLVQEMIEDIDKSKVLSQRCIQSPILGQISPDYLSGGVKTLIMLLKEPNYHVDLMVCGNNCTKWIKEVAKHQDLHLAISTYDLDYPDIVMECLNDGDIIDSEKKWWDKIYKYV